MALKIGARQGEGGFLLCNYDQAEIIRRMINFGVNLPDEAKAWASNFQISDLAADGIYDTIERMPHWEKFYRLQFRQMRFLMIDTDMGLDPHLNKPNPKFPKAHTPFIALLPISLPKQGVRKLTIQKYYKPLTTTREHISNSPKAQKLYTHNFSLPNTPEMLFLSNDDIITEVRSQLFQNMDGR